MTSRSTNWLLTLLGRSSAIALAVGCGAGVAQVNKAFQGSYNVRSGDAYVSQGSTTNSDTISLNSSQAVIDWTPDDTGSTGAIDFLPQGKTATFSSFGDFTVLNRILPLDGNGLPVSRVVELNGTVQSQISGSTGGSVWFYAPGGILAGANSVFNVGSLVLTSNDIDTTGGLYGSDGNGNSNVVRFRGATNVLSSVELKPGAQVNALSSGSYVALVAPRVVQGGTVTVNGTAAYVGAESADITINGGLFDISISAGTTDANGVVHTGTTARPTTSDSSDAQHVFLVAMPKNNALTMLLSGDVGYSAADTAVQSGSAVVLAAGRDVTGNAVGARNATGTGEAGISIGGGTWQPDVSGQATGGITIQPGAATVNFANVDLTAERAITAQVGAGGAIALGGNLTLKAGEAITLRADQGGAVTVGGDATLTAGVDGTGGTIDLLAFGGSGSATGNGQISVTGALDLDAGASGLGDLSAPLTAAGDATAGTIHVTATGGSVSAGSLYASAFAQSGEGSDRSGNATGGTISLSALTIAGPAGTEAGTLTFGSIGLEAGAQAPSHSYYSTATQGGNATAGTITVAATGGGISADDIFMSATGSGGGSLGVAGIGMGGSITLSSAAAGGLRGNFAVAGCSNECTIRADGYGGSGQTGAAGQGGSILIHATDADFAIGGNLYLESGAVGGGTVYDGLAGRGGDGTGGSVAVESRAGAAGSAVMTFGSLHASADGRSTEDVEGPTFNGGDGGSGIGGSVSLLVAGGSLTADGIFAGASGLGGASDINCPTCEGGGGTAFQSGSGQGGTTGFLISGGSATIGTLELIANGGGGEAYAAGGAGETSSIAGQGIGGAATLESRGGTLHAGFIGIGASGFGGSGYDTYLANGVDGATGIGGSAKFLMSAGGTGQVTADDGIIIHAVGEGGTGASTASDGGFYLAGAGGGGTGGTAEVTLAGGMLTAPSLLLSAAGFGGAGGDNGSDGPGGAAGNGTGGTAQLSYLNEGHALGDVTVKADGEGGEAGRNGSYGYDNNGNLVFFYGAGQGGAGGSGSGGLATMLVDVDPSFANLTISADGIGSTGASSATTSNGGAGTGGVAVFDIGFGATSVSGALKVSASGLGGDGGIGFAGAGGRGGDAFGGSATLSLAGASTLLDAGDISVLAQALGGAGGVSGQQSGAGLAGADGGNATGGAALFAVTSGANALTGALLKISGDATGGAGSAGTAGTTGGAGGSGGGALAGSARLSIDGGGLRYDSALSTRPAYAITAVGTGGAGADGGVGTDPGLSGGAGGNGGSGAGGAASFAATDADFVLGDLSIIADGVAGIGGAGGSAPGGSSPAGLIGLSSGGTASLSHGGSTVLAPAVQRVMNSLTMRATGQSGGRLLFTDSSSAAGGGLQISGALSMNGGGTSVAGFTGIALSSSGNPVAIGGDADFTTEGPLSFAFGGSGGLGVAGALTGYSGTAITIDHAARAAGTDSLSAASLLLRTAGGIGLSGDSRLSAGGLLTMLAQGGDISLATGSSLAAGGDLRLFAAGSVLGAGSSLVAGGSAAIGLGGAGDIRLGSLSSGGLLDMADATGAALGTGGLALGGDFVVSGLLAVGPGSGTLSARNISIGTLTGGSQALSATGAVTIGDADLPGQLQIATSGAAQLTGSVNVGSIAIDAGSIGVGAIAASTGDLQLRSVAALTIGAGRAAGNVLLQSSGAGLTVGSVSAGGLLTLRGAGITGQALTSVGAALLDAGAGDLVVTDIAAPGAISASGRDITLGSTGAMTIADATASGSIGLTAGGLLSLLGRIGGTSVGLTSADIAIGATGQIVAAGSLRFAALAGQQGAVIGGGDVAGGYSLSAAELARVAASDIGMAGAGDIFVRDLTIGTAILPAAGTLSIATPGRLRVEGALRMTGRSGQGGLSLSAGQRLEVIADTGLVEVTDGNGAFGGLLTLSSPAVYAASLAAIADVDAATSLAARNQRLSLNDGAAGDAGLLRAGAIRIDASGGVYIQNSGLSASFSDRRGFTADSLTITSGTARPEIVINGRLTLAAGGYATGLSAIPLVAVGGAYVAGSTINGCLIAGASACTSSGSESRDNFDGRLDPTASIPRIFPLALIQLRDIVAEGFPPLIDEPVTGAGNEDLWERRCGGEGEPACNPQ